MCLPGLLHQELVTDERAVTYHFSGAQSLGDSICPQEQSQPGLAGADLFPGSLLFSWDCGSRTLGLWDHLLVKSANEKTSALHQAGIIVECCCGSEDR